MGYGEQLKGHKLREWQKIFKALIAVGAPTDKDMNLILRRGSGGRQRVVNIWGDGRKHNDAGQGCCGCGFHEDTSHPNYGKEAIMPGHRQWHGPSWDEINAILNSDHEVIKKYRAKR